MMMSFNYKSTNMIIFFGGKNNNKKTSVKKG